MKIGQMFGSKKPAALVDAARVGRRKARECLHSLRTQDLSNDARIWLGMEARRLRDGAAKCMRRARRLLRGNS